MKKLIAAFLLISNLSISGCMYREYDPFKQSNDADYKFRLNFFGLFAKKEAQPTCLIGVVLLEDNITPLGNTHILLKKVRGQILVSDNHTDNSGMFIFTQLLQGDSYVIEIDSPNFAGSKGFIVDPIKSNRIEIIANKKQM